MKTHLYKIFILIICSISLLSCDKDDEATVMNGTIAPVLSMSSSPLTLNSADAQTTRALKLSWTAADYGYVADVDYYVQVDKKGNLFTTPVEKIMKDLSRTSDNNLSGWSGYITHYTLDSLINGLGVNTPTATEFEVRLKAVASGPLKNPVYSAPLVVTITPYRDAVESPAVLTSSTATFDDSSTAPVKFTWTPTVYSLGNDVTYTLQLDNEATFTEPKKISVAGDNKEFPIADFNALVQELGIQLGAEGTVYARLESTQAGSITGPSLSNVVTIVSAPFILKKPLYVPGGHQGWSPATAPAIYSLSGDEKYSGYVYFENANNIFKLTTHPDWEHTNYGSGGEGKLSATGDNLSVTDAGYYLIKADLIALTWSAQRTSWGVIGSATPTGWDSDSDMAYDATSKTLKVTLALTAGEIKFRANDAWALNYGDNGGDGSVEEGGANITISEAGTYVIGLDLTDPDNYTYSLTKQ